jgi:hypothetical protein
MPVYLVWPPTSGPIRTASGNGMRVIVEDASRFARDLMAQAGR